MEIKPVDITPGAIVAIKKIMLQKKVPDGYGLRISVAEKGISCGSTNYSLGFDQKTSDDLNYIEEALEVIVKKVEVVHLSGLILDYVTVEEQTGFSFSRAN